MKWDYIRNPEEIERQSFLKIKTLCSLDNLSREDAQLAMRLVHTAGDPSVLDDLFYTKSAVQTGLQALANQAPILCDVEMVRHGISKRFIRNLSYCYLNQDDTVALAKQQGISRSMAAVEHWRPRLSGAIVVIGNAPTALFRLLELLDAGALPPALIIGMPVGFIGAAESKQALIEYQHKHPTFEIITLHGRRGGSAYAAAALNAIGRMHQGTYL